MDKQSTELMRQIAAILKDKLAFNVEVINIGEVSIIADYFVIASGRTDAHVHALYEYVDEGIKEKTGLDPLHTEGTDNARWIVMDYGDALVHIFKDEDRLFYNLERLWNNGENTYVVKS